MTLEQTQQLSPRETTLLKHIVSRGQKQDRIISFSMKNVCKELELDDLEFLDTLVSLSLKGYIRIARLPCSEEVQVELRRRFLQADVLCTVFRSSHLVEKKDRITKMLAAMATPDSKWAEMTSLEELLSHSLDLDQMLQQMNENQQSTDHGQETQEEQKRPARRSEQRILRLQQKLDRCLKDFWEGVELLKEESHGVESAAPRIVDAAGLSTASRKETKAKRPAQEKTARMIALLLAIRANAVTKSAAPSELVEELEELEARALIGEITQELLKTKKKEFEQRVEQTQFAIVSISDIGQLISRLRRRIEHVDALASAGLISKASQAKITESATLDLEHVEKASVEQLADFYVSPSGDLLEKAPSTPYVRSS